MRQFLFIIPVCLGVFCLPTEIWGQTQIRDEATSRVSVASTLGMHALGFGVDYRLHPRASILVRTAGMPITGILSDAHAFTAVGARLNALTYRGVTLYFTGMIGRMKKTLESDGVMEAFGSIAGAEIPLAHTRRWSIGLEAGYWLTFFDDYRSDAITHGGVDLILRFRP